jgi:hypothetical protein
MLSPIPIPEFHPDAARIGYANVLVSTDVPALDAALPTLNKNTWERYRPALGAMTIDYQMGNVDTEINYIAIAAHGLSGETILIQTSATEGGALTDVESITFTDNSPIFITFPTRTIREVKITSTLIAASEIGVVYAGHSPLPLSQKTKYRNTMSDTGNFLGRTIVRQGLDGSFDWQYLDPDWYRTVFQPFVVAARTTPFFIQWNQQYPDEIIFGYSKNDIKPTNMGGGHSLMSVSLSMRGHADT